MHFQFSCCVQSVVVQRKSSGESSVVWSVSLESTHDSIASVLAGSMWRVSIPCVRSGESNRHANQVVIWHQTCFDRFPQRRNALRFMVEPSLKTLANSEFPVL